MRALFVHNNFPAQFLHLAPALKARGWEIAAIGSPTARSIANIPLTRYKLNRGTTDEIFPLAIRWEADAMRGAAVAGAAQVLQARGFTPDLIVGHVGWGETLFLPDIWPAARNLTYAEFFVRPQGLDVGFDPEFGDVDLDRAMRVRVKNGAVLAALAQADAALAPTRFQRDTFPAAFRNRITICHDGIDTEEVRPREGACYTLPDGRALTADDEVVTYLNRHLEPLRGLHIFLRALPDIMARRPRAQIVIVGKDHPRPYGQPAPAQTTWRDMYLQELSGQLDLSRLHFVGLLPRADYLNLLAISCAHVYLTYPFVLSWSLIEAMSAGCCIVASDTAPVREVIADGKNGRLVRFFDRSALSETVCEVLAAPDRFANLRQQARADAIAAFDLQTVCLPRLVSLAEQTANSPKQS